MSFKQLREAALAVVRAQQIHLTHGAIVAWYYGGDTQPGSHLQIDHGAIIETEEQHNRLFEIKNYFASMLIRTVRLLFI